MNSNFLHFPFRINKKGETSKTDYIDHIRDLIHQVLFTNPGERVNKPDFGCGLKQLIFMPNSSVLATTTQFLVQGSLQRWLNEYIQVEQVEVQCEEEKLTITVVYKLRSNGVRYKDTFANK
jgi:phage baseplate assembly protein W